MGLWDIAELYFMTFDKMVVAIFLMYSHIQEIVISWQ